MLGCFSFHLLSSPLFAVVNLLVGLIVNSMQDAHHEDEHAEALAHRDELMLRLNAIEKKLDQLSK